jgi:drug/metabolite transporter (DMT)-like permease
MSWQIYLTISVLTLSISIILQRVLIHKDKLDPYGYAVFFQSLVSVILLVFLALNGFRFPDLSGLWVQAISSAILFGAGHIVYAKTLQVVEASIFSVLFASHAVWIMAAGILFLDESLSVIQIVGSVMIFASVFLVTKNLKSFKLDKGTLLGLFTGLLFGLAIALYSYVGRHTDTLSWSAFSFVGAALSALLFRPKTIGTFKKFMKASILPKLTLLSIFYAAGSLTLLYAYKEGAFAVVSPLRQTGIIVTVLMALAFLPKERNQIAKKIVASLVCTAGVVLLIV